MGIICRQGYKILNADDKEPCAVSIDTLSIGDLLAVALIVLKIVGYLSVWSWTKTIVIAVLLALFL